MEKNTETGFISGFRYCRGLEDKKERDLGLILYTEMHKDC